MLTDSGKEELELWYLGPQEAEPFLSNKARDSKQARLLHIFLVCPVSVIETHVKGTGESITLHDALQNGSVFT